MSRIARERGESAGVDMDALMAKLEAAARAKLAAYYRYTILNAGSVGVEGEDLRQVLIDVRTEHRNHFDALITRIYELDGRLPIDINLFTAAEEPSGELPTHPPALVVALIEAGMRMIHTSEQLCDLTRGKDHRTYELAHAILTEETEHEAWFNELLGQGPGARFHRGFRGRSPHLAHLPPHDPDSN